MASLEYALAAVPYLNTALSIARIGKTTSLGKISVESISFLKSRLLLWLQISFIMHGSPNFLPLHL